MNSAYKSLLIPIMITIICCIILPSIIYICYGGFLLNSAKININLFIFVGAYVSLFIFLFILCFKIIGKHIKRRIEIPLNQLQNDLISFYENNQSDFKLWNQKVIKGPKEIANLSRYIHSHLAKLIIDLHNSLNHDYLTGLRTNIRLRKDMEEYPNHVIAVLNISNFKEINSFYGVELADDVLCSVANIIKEYFKDEDFLLYRVHSDDFAVLWSNCVDMDMFISKLENFMVFLEKQEIAIDGHTYLNINSTLGIASSHDGGYYSMVNAIMALHHAKEYKNSIVIYNKSLPILNSLKSNIVHTRLVHKAIKNKKIIPYLQKIVPINDDNSSPKSVRELNKYEALMRIQDEDGRTILPGDFLEISKRSNAYYTLSRQMIEKTFKSLSYKKDLCFSINLALEDINSMSARTWLMDAIIRHGVEGRVIIEITEEASIKDFNSVSNFIVSVRELGILVALDDFGSGYSNFDVLTKLKIDYLKIDGSIVMSAHKDENARIIIETIVSFSKRLGIKTIAEFVSSAEIYETIKKLGVDYAQGYYVGKPTELALNDI